MALTISLLFCYLVCLFIAMKADDYHDEIINKKKQPEQDLSELTIDDFINQ